MSGSRKCLQAFVFLVIIAQLYIGYHWLSLKSHVFASIPIILSSIVHPILLFLCLSPCCTCINCFRDINFGQQPQIMEPMVVMSQGRNNTITDPPPSIKPYNNNAVSGNRAFIASLIEPSVSRQNASSSK